MRTTNSPIILKDIWGSEIDQVRNKSVNVVVANSEITGYDWMLAVKGKYKEANEKIEKEKAQKEALKKS
jgi:hypothetical protein